MIMSNLALRWEIETISEKSQRLPRIFAFREAEGTFAFIQILPFSMGFSRPAGGSKCCFSAFGLLFYDPQFFSDLYKGIYCLVKVFSLVCR